MRIGFLKSSHPVLLLWIVLGGCGGRSSDGDQPANVAGTSSLIVGLPGSSGMISYASSGGSAGISGLPGSTGISSSISNGGIVGVGGTINVGGTPTLGTSTCPNITTSTPCGGKVVGRWLVNSGSLGVSGDMDVSLLGLGCSTVRANGCLQVGGLWVANSDGSYEDYTSTTGSITFTLPPACLSISSVPVDCSRVGQVFTALGWASATCSNTQGECVCMAIAAQTGGIGAISPVASTTGAYSTTGNTLTIDDFTQYSYCVSGQTLTITPNVTGTTGSLQLWMSNSTGGSMNSG